MRPHQITGCSSSPIDNEHTHVLLFYVFLQLIVFLSKKNYVNMTKMSLFKAGPMFRKSQHSFDCSNARLWWWRTFNITSVKIGINPLSLRLIVHINEIKLMWIQKAQMPKKSLQKVTVFIRGFFCYNSIGLRFLSNSKILTWKHMIDLPFYTILYKHSTGCHTVASLVLPRFPLSETACVRARVWSDCYLVL